MQPGKLQGDLELTKDRRTLARARELLAVLEATVRALEAGKGLSVGVQVELPVKVKNTFV